MTFQVGSSQAPAARNRAAPKPLSPQFDLMQSCSFHLRIPCSIFRYSDHNFVCISRLFNSCYKPRPSSPFGFVAVMLGDEYQICLLEFSPHIPYLLSSPANLCLQCRVVRRFPVTPLHPHAHETGSRPCNCLLSWKCLGRGEADGFRFWEKYVGGCVGA